jgi:hypothetical protein
MLLVWVLSSGHITPCSHSMAVKNGIQVDVQERRETRAGVLELQLLD